MAFLASLRDTQVSSKLLRLIHSISNKLKKPIEDHLFSPDTPQIDYQYGNNKERPQGSIT